MVETPEEVAERVVSVAHFGCRIECGDLWIDVGEPSSLTREVIAAIIREDRESRVAPDRGTLINAEESACNEFVSAREALRAVRAMDVVDFERAKARVVTAEAKWEEARAALVEAK